MKRATKDILRILFNLPEIIGVFPKYEYDEEGKLIQSGFLYIKSRHRPTLIQRIKGAINDSRGNTNAC